MPVSVLFSHGYSKPLCSLDFPSSSQRTHRSCVSSLFTLWPHCHLITVPGLLLDYRMGSAPVMQLLRAEILTPFPVFILCSCLIAWPVLLCPISCQLLCVSRGCQNFPLTLCFLFQQLSASYGISFFSVFSKIFFNLFQRHCYSFSGIGAFQVLNELARKYG